MTNDQIFIAGMVASFVTGVAGTIFFIRLNYLLKHRPRFNRRQRMYIRAMESSPFIKSKQK